MKTGYPQGKNEVQLKASGMKVCVQLIWVTKSYILDAVLSSTPHNSYVHISMYTY